MAAEFFASSDRAEYCRQLAADIRARAASMKTAAARDALAVVADDYELLARYTRSVEVTWRTLRQRPDEERQQNEDAFPSRDGSFAPERIRSASHPIK